MKYLFSRFFSALSCLALALPAFALIDVQPQVARVGSTPITVDVTNNGERDEYVSIALSRLLNPGVELADERLEPITLVSQPRLFAYPFKLMLGPGQSKTIIVKPLERVEQEQVYRLDVTPVLNPLAPQQPTVVGKVAVNLAFSALVRHLPSQQTAHVQVTCEAGGARFIATGNTRSQVKGVSVNGQPSEPFNVYPGVPIVIKGASILIPEHPGCSGTR